MKVEENQQQQQQCQPTIPKEANGKDQPSIIDLMKIYNDFNEGDIETSIKRQITETQQKQISPIKDPKKSKYVSSPTHQKDKIISQQQIISISPNNHELFLHTQENSNKKIENGRQKKIIKNKCNYIQDKIIKIIKLENVCKEDLQPYWRNKLLLIVILVFLIFRNSNHLYHEINEESECVNYRIGIICLIFSFIISSVVLIIIFINYSNRPQKQQSFSSQFKLRFSRYINQNINNKLFMKGGKKIVFQIIVICLCTATFILYSIVLQKQYISASTSTINQNNTTVVSSNSTQNFSNSNSNYVSEQLCLQIFEMILLYEYVSCFFLSYFIMKIILMASAFIIINIFIGIENHIDAYYFFIVVLLIQLLHEYEQINISIQFQFYYNHYISQSSLVTESKQLLKNHENQNHTTDINRNQKNGQYYLDTHEFGRFQNKKNNIEKMNQNLINNINNISEQKASIEAVKGITINSEQNEFQTTRNFINYNPTNKASQRSFYFNEMNVIENNSRQKKGSSKVDQFYHENNLEMHNIKEGRSKSSGREGDCHIRNSKSKSNQSDQKNGQIKRISEFENKNQIKNIEIQFSSADKIKVCQSETSKDNIQSSKAISNKSITSSQNLSSNHNIKASNLSYDISPINRLYRNFSLFRREQEQIQSQIEEKTSQEEAGNYTMTGHPNQIKRNKTYSFQKSHSLGIQQMSNLMQQEILKSIRIINENSKENKKLDSLQEKSDDEDPSNQLFTSNFTNNNYSNSIHQYTRHIINNQNNISININKNYDNYNHYENKSENKNSLSPLRTSSKNDNKSKESKNKTNKIQRNYSKQISMDYKRDKSNRMGLRIKGFQKTQTSYHSMPDNQQKAKLYKNILKYLPEKGVLLIDKNRNIHFANHYIQQLFPRSNYLFLFNELIQLKSIETLGEYNDFFHDIIEQKQNDINQNENNKVKNISQNLTKVQLTDSITSNINNQEGNNNKEQNSQFGQMNNFNPNQQLHGSLMYNQIPIQIQKSKTYLRNIPQQNSNSNNNSFHFNTNSFNTHLNNNSNLHNPINNQSGNNSFSNNNNTNNIQNNNNINTITQIQQITCSSNQNFPLNYPSPCFNPFSSSMSINPNQKLSQSNYFMKLDLFKQPKVNVQPNDNGIKCKSFLEQFEQILDNFKYLSATYKQYGIASQNKKTLLLYRPLNNKKQDTIEDVQIFEVQFIPCYLGYTEGVIVLIRDVSHFNQIKVLKDINEKKSDILRNVSHELRQPLNCIISMMQLTRDSYTDPTLIQEYINPTLYSCQILLNLLNDFLDFSQIQAGTFNLNPVQFNIKKLFQNVFQMMKAQIKIRSLNFILNIINENDIPDQIKSDPHRIQQIITNLLGNAVKFTEQGDITLSLEKVAPLLYKISVADSGIGITEEGQKNLFKTFGKVDQDRKSILNPQGVGLGLMISNILARQLGPNENKGLNVESKIGQGTKFFLYIEDKADDHKDVILTKQIIESKEKNNQSNKFVHSEMIAYKNMETSLFSQQGYRIKEIEQQSEMSQQPSVELINAPKNIIMQKAQFKSTIQHHQSISFDNLQEISSKINQLPGKNSIMPTYVHENNIKSIDLKNSIFLPKNNNHNNSNNIEKSRINKSMTPKQLEIAQNDFLIMQQEKDSNYSKQHLQIMNNIQYSQLITQDIALKRQTLILQQDFSPSVQKQLLEDIVQYVKNKTEQTCQECNTKDILIVDDNDFNIYVLDKYIKSFSLTDETSTNGPSSEKKVKEKIEGSKCKGCKTYKMIFMDLNLGQQSGILTAQNIFQIYAAHQLQPPPFIACTGHVDQGIIQECLDNGFSDFLAKPIVKDNLVQIIHKYLFIDN